MSVMDREKISHKVRCILAEEETLEYGKRLAKMMQELYVEEEAKKEVTSSFNARIKMMNNQIAALSDVVSGGAEWRLKDCWKEFDFERGMVRIVCCETGECVDTRAMTREEKQLAMAF